MKLFDEYFRQRSDLVEANLTPRTVLFSQAGYSRAMKEAMPDSNHFDGAAGAPRTYCGLPYIIDPALAAELVVTHEAPELVSQRLQAGKRQRQNAISFAMKGSFGKLGEEPPTMIKLVAQSLDAATLCDIIMEWLGQDPHWGDFEKALHKVVEEHGTFE
jgi:hypothetical protein